MRFNNSDYDTSMRYDDKNIGTDMDCDMDCGCCCHIESCNDYYNENYYECEKEYYCSYDVIIDIVDDILKSSDFHINIVMGNCVVISCKLPNGFVVTESCVFDFYHDRGIEDATSDCCRKIRNKVIEFENYKNMSNIYEEMCE